MVTEFGLEVNLTKCLAQYRIDQCLIEGKNRRDQLHQAYATLGSKDIKRNKLITVKEEIAELLKASEIVQLDGKDEKLTPHFQDFSKPKVKSRLLINLPKSEEEDEGKGTLIGWISKQNFCR